MEFAADYFLNLQWVVFIDHKLSWKENIVFTPKSERSIGSNPPAKYSTLNGEGKDVRLSTTY
jgi:hypothetical protein